MIQELTLVTEFAVIMKPASELVIVLVDGGIFFL